MSGERLHAGFTYIELLIVLSFMCVFGVIVTPMLAGRVESARATVTLTSMQQVRQAINDEYYDNQFQSVPFPADPERSGHPQLAFLYVNPDTYSLTSEAGTTQWSYDPLTKRGWSGPYLTPGGYYLVDVDRGFLNLYGESGDPAPLDGWGNPIVLQQAEPLGSTAAYRNRRFARLISAGVNGVIDTPPDVAAPGPNDLGDDLIVPLFTN